MSALLTPTGPELRLLVSLAAWSGPGTGPHFPGASRRLRLPSRPDWAALVARTGTAVLLLGLEPLSQSAGASQLDTYLDTASGADRLLFGLARSC